MASSRDALRAKLGETLSNRALGKVLSALRQLAGGEFAERLSTLEDTYRTMLRYHFEGAVDPSQEEVMSHLLRETWELTDEVFAAKSAKPFSEHPVFNALWEPVRYKDDQVQLMRRLLADKSKPIDAQLAVSAVMLSTLYLFDETKLLCLIEACSAPDTAVSLRATTGLVLVLMAHAKRLEYYPAVTNALQLLLDDARHIRDAQNVLRYLLLCHETERISKDMRDNIIPAISKAVREMPDKPKLDADDPEREENEYLEYWEEVSRKSGIDDKMQDLSQRKLEGYDVNYTSYCQLKQYPFFKQLENWFMPFDRNHASFRNLLNNEQYAKIANILLRNDFMCDSDKYSFLFTLEQMPAEYLQSANVQLNIERSQNEDNDIESSAAYINFYLHDLYRFFKLHPAHADFTDVFGLSPDMGRLPFFRYINPENVFLPEWGSRLMKSGLYEAALSALLKEESGGATSAALYQKLGYCYQKTGDYESAVANYLKADIILPDHQWTLGKLAYCYRQTKEYAKAIELYQQLDSGQPNQLRYIEPLAFCLCADGQLAYAKRLFDKMEYLWPDRRKSSDYSFYHGLTLWDAGERRQALAQWKAVASDQLEGLLRSSALPLAEQEIQFICDYFRF